MNAATAPCLDKSMFDQTIQLRALRVPKARCGPIMAKLRGCAMPLLRRHITPSHSVVLQRARMRSVVDDPDSPDYRRILLDAALLDVPEAALLATSVTKGGTVGAALEGEADVQWVEHTVHVGYAYWSTSHILRVRCCCVAYSTCSMYAQRLLPEGVEVPSAYEAIGHIAHLNLRDEHQPWKHIIAQVLLDKNPAIKTVVNKVWRRVASINHHVWIVITARWAALKTSFGCLRWKCSLGHRRW